MSKKNFYVVVNGRNPGTYRTWNECKEQVEGFSNAKFKGFTNVGEAQEYIKLSDSKNLNASKKFISKINIQTAENENVKPKKIIKTATRRLRKTKLAESVSPIFKKPEFNSDSNLNMDLVYDSVDFSRVHVYTDGSCRKTKAGNVAGFGVYFGDNSILNIGAKYEGVQTNNRAEIAAVVKAVEMASKHGINKLLVHTDSKFVINCMTQWIDKWKKNNWLLSNNKEAECRDELEKLDNLIKETEIDIQWKHVRGHKGIKGNEMADKLANKGADQWIKP